MVLLKKRKHKTPMIGGGVKSPPYFLKLNFSHKHYFPKPTYHSVAYDIIVSFNMYCDLLGRRCYNKERGVLRRGGFFFLKVVWLIATNLIQQIRLT